MAVITQVDPESEAMQQGLKPGMVVLGVGSNGSSHAARLRGGRRGVEEEGRANGLARRL